MSKVLDERYINLSLAGEDDAMVEKYTRVNDFAMNSFPMLEGAAPILATHRSKENGDEFEIVYKSPDMLYRFAAMATKGGNVDVSELVTIQPHNEERYTYVNFLNDV